MESTENLQDRINRVDMHNFFLEKIGDAMQHDRYIEATWLIYSCFENRYFRTIEKIKKFCKHSGGRCKKATNELALSTKISCIQRLSADASCTCFSNNFPVDLLDETKAWVKNRNTLMHNLLQLDYYETMDNEFKESAETGRDLLLQTYECCTNFRRDFYSENYVFVFPESAMEGCCCKPQKKKTENEIA